MAFSGGVYTLPGPALVTGEIVSATENNQLRNDMAASFNLTMLRNGTSTATANLPMGGYKLTGLGVATTSGDALSYGQAAVVSTLGATGDVTLSGGTANGVAYLNGSKVLTTGSALTFNGTTLTAAGFAGPLTGNVTGDVSGNAGTVTNGVYTTGDQTIGGNKTFSSNPILSAGTANGVAYLNGSKVLTTGSAFVFDGSNLGLGVTPSAWNTFTASFQIAGASLSGLGANNTALGSNAYYNSGWKYYGTASASLYQQNAGQHAWSIAGSGTAGNAISFTQAMTLDASGNLCVGNTSALFGNSGRGVLNVNGSSTALISLSSGSSQSTAGYMYWDGTNTQLVHNATTGSLIFGVNAATERMRIDSSGNVGIGTSSPASTKLHSYQSSGSTIAGLFQTNQTESYITFQGSATSSFTTVRIGANGDNLVATVGGSERMRIDSSGNLQGGGATVTGGSNNIWWLGTYNNLTASAANMYVASNGSFQRSTSAKKYKQDIRDLESIDITLFRPVRYKSILENDDQSKDHIGFIADEISDLGLTEIVNYGDDGEVEGLQYERITAILTKAIQEQQEQINQLKAEVAALKGA